MKKLLVATAFICLLGIPAFAADDTPVFEIFGGYTLGLADTEDFADTYDEGIERFMFNGFTGAGEFNIRSWIGIPIEFTYAKASETGLGGEFKDKTFTFLVGPRFGYRSDRVRVFGHALFGMQRNDYSSPYYNYEPESRLAIAFGGGLDIAINEMISIRAGIRNFLLPRDIAL